MCINPRSPVLSSMFSAVFFLFVVYWYELVWNGLIHCLREKVNPYGQCAIEMPNLNVSWLCALVFDSVCERTTKFHGKILFDRTFSRSGMVSVASGSCSVSGNVLRRISRHTTAVSSLRHTNLFFVDQGTKVNGQYYRDVLLHQQLLSALRDLSGDLTFQQDNAWDRAAVNLWNTRLYRSSSVASQQFWPKPGRLSDVGNHRSRMHDVDQLKSRLIEEWKHFHQVFVDEAIRQWRPRLRACIRAHGGHFEDRL